MPQKALTHLDLGGNQVLKHRVENLATDPVGAELYSGRIWFNTTVGQLRWYDGGVVRAALLSPITSADIADGTIATADMTANSINGDRITDATLHGNKIVNVSIHGQTKLGVQTVTPDRLAGMGAVNRVLATTDGINVALQQIVSAMIGVGQVVGGAGGNIASNTIIGGNILDGTIDTAKLAAGAVSRMTSSIWSGSTTAPPWATVSTIPFTSSGGPTTIWLTGVINISVAFGLAYLGYGVDGGGFTQVGVQHIPTAGNYITMTAVANIGSPAVGAHNLNILMATSGGTIQAYSGSYLVILELKR